ncbi:MFS transporter, putative [Cordyceps militaris CM01]|uniref:MFS transporter, putative n=1 Tax=Cordyceps militaris (strain CM01) TaxID=983644 RepID=G3JTF2_CORMM|nr:MFS transporter, putative [Cordyceps militaris CM01]EGX88299.1 MFS transporter, putative [Cordyceps militaris CM01]
MLAAAHLRDSRKGIQKKDALEQCMWDMIRRRIDPLTKSSAHRISPEQLRAEWNIVVQKLDLDTGRPDHGETFIQPIPIHQIDSWIKEFRPLEYPSRRPYDYDLFDIYDRVEDAGEGKEISRGISRMVKNYTMRSHSYKLARMLTYYGSSFLQVGEAQLRCSRRVIALIATLPLFQLSYFPALDATSALFRPASTLSTITSTYAAQRFSTSTREAYAALTKTCGASIPSLAGCLVNLLEMLRNRKVSARTKLTERCLYKVVLVKHAREPPLVNPAASQAAASSLSTLVCPMKQEAQEKPGAATAGTSTPALALPDAEKQQPEEQAPAASLTLHGARLWLILAVLCLSIYLLALELTMLSTVVPTLTDEFGTVADISWYEAAYVLPLCVLMPVVAKLYDQFRIKHVYLACMLFFELGLVICAVAESSRVFILGRALNGLGASGQFNGCIIVLSSVCDASIRPLATSLVMSMLPIGSMTGPIIAGVVTARIGWRWCFWILVPMGAGVIIIFAIVKIAEQSEKPAFREGLQRLPRSLVAGVGSGLCTTLAPNTSVGKWVGFQIITSIGRGVALQAPITAVQEYVPIQHHAVSISILSLFLQLGIAVSVSSCQTIFNNRLPALLQRYAPGVDITMIVEAGATKARHFVEPAQLPGFLYAYNKAVTSVFSRPRISRKTHSW